MQNEPIKLNELSWMKTAKELLGVTEVKGVKHHPIIIKMLNYLGAWWKEDETAWCGVFTAYCLKKNGIKIPKHWYRAKDYLNAGALLTKPAYGCIAIKSRVGGGHVCFVAGITPQGKLVCLGGNQSNKVCYALYDVKDFEQFRWYGKTSTPLQGRYTLPILTNVTATKVTES